VVLVGNDALIEHTEGSILAAPLDQSGAAPDLLVTVSITRPVEGVVRADLVGPVRRKRFGELIGRLDPSDMDRVDVALRAALDL
jgi:mRNA-degrading endonuclease toxin of MazEF toxin-antitoxin module